MTETPADSRHQDEPEVKEKVPIAVPEGIGISDIRKTILPSQTLFVRFVSKEGKGEIKLSEKDGSRTFVLTTGIDYQVNVNAGDQHEVYLNPVVSGQAPEESNISEAVDRFLSKDGNRKKLGVEVQVSSSDADLREVILKLNSKVYAESTRRFEKIFRELDLEGVVSSAFAQENINFEKGPRSGSLVSRSVYTWVEYLFFEGVMKGENLDVRLVVEEKIGEFVKRIKEIVKVRVPQLKEAASHRGQVALAFDVVNMFSEDENEGMYIAMGYKPKFGWGMAVPFGDCPNLAANFFWDAFGGKASKGNEMAFEELVTNETQGKVNIDRQSKIVVYDNRDGNLDPAMAVFHPGGSVREAFETMDMVTDPIRGRGTFAMLVLGDTSELELEDMPPIKLDFD